MIKRYLLNPIFVIVMLVQVQHTNAQIFASPVFDAPNNTTGTILKIIAKSSKFIRETMMPIKAAISSIQSFFEKANTVVNAVIKNMKMLKDLIDTEKRIRTLFYSSAQQIEQSENLIDRWKHLWIITQLFRQALDIFQVFQMTEKQGQTIMDDEQRIILIQQTLRQLRKIHSAMKIAIRRTNKSLYKWQRTQKELEVFDRVFSPN